MAILPKFGKKAPKWAGALTADVYAAFRQKLLDASNGQIDPGKANKAGEISLGKLAINLTNLAVMCSQLEQNEWPAEIKRWVKAFSESEDRPDPAYPRDIKMLKLQLYPGNYFDEVPSRAKAFLTQEDIPGTLTTIVIDWPDSVAAFRNDPGSDWDKHKKEIFRKLHDHLAKTEPYKVAFFGADKENDDVFAVIEGEDIMTATHALVLDKLYPQLIGNKGALVGVPFRHMIIVKRLDDEPTPEQLESMSNFVDYMAGQTNYLISNQVYRFKNGKFIPELRKPH